MSDWTDINSDYVMARGPVARVKDKVGWNISGPKEAMNFQAAGDGRI